jgi:uncharacterized repeat protein (TIGR03803 family)
MRRFSLLLAGVLLASCSRVTNEATLPPVQPSEAMQGAAPETLDTLVYSFNGLHSRAKPDGIWPIAGLAELGGVFYGTTYGGGGASGNCAQGCGTVYAVTARGVERVLHAFSGAPDGAIPKAGVTAVNGRLYGTTFYGGTIRSNECSAGRGCGTIFYTDANDNETVLYRFRGGSDGSNPQGGLLLAGGTLYGTTTGGLNGRLCAGQKVGNRTVYGTVFKLTPTGSGYSNYSVIHRFTGGGGDGACPIGNLVDLNGTLYGVTFDGGTYNAGTIFYLTRAGKERIIHSFASARGDYPVGLVFVNNMLYGTASADGQSRSGAIFSITPQGRHFAIVHAFGGTGKFDGAQPYAEPIVVSNKLYGTTEGGGEDGVGTIYQSTLQPPYKECVVHNFMHPPADGTRSNAPLLLYKNMLYGTTTLGGSHPYYVSTHGRGAVFKIAPKCAL